MQGGARFTGLEGSSLEDVSTILRSAFVNAGPDRITGTNMNAMM